MYPHSFFTPESSIEAPRVLLSYPILQTKISAEIVSTKVEELKKLLVKQKKQLPEEEAIRSSVFQGQLVLFMLERIKVQPNSAFKIVIDEDNLPPILDAKVVPSLRTDSW